MPLKTARKRTADGVGAKDGAGSGEDGTAPAPKAAKKEVSAANGASAATADPAGKSADLRVPDAAEVLEISRTQNLYKSNLFRLQLEELLNETAPRSSNPKLEAFLRGLQPALEALEEREIGEDFRAVFPALYFHQRHPYAFTFKRPQRIDVVGSFLLGTCMRSRLSADIALEMPSDSFQSKDYLNFRFADKRAAYVGELHRQLSSVAATSGEKGPLQGVEVCFESMQGDPYRPVVALRPASPDSGEGVAAPWMVRLMPTVSADLWPVSKLAPERNALRPKDAPAAQGCAAQATPPPSCHYNSCVLEDMHMREQLEIMHRALGRTPALKDAVLLLKRWAAARGFLPPLARSGSAAAAALARHGPAAAVPFTPLNGFCLTAVAAHVALTSNVSPTQTSSFQLFKLALGLLGNTDWSSQKLIFGIATPAALSEQEKEGCGAHFYASNAPLNYFWRVGPFMQEVKQEADRALKILDARADPFDDIFGGSSSLEINMDLVIRTPPLPIEALCPEFHFFGGSSGSNSSGATVTKEEAALLPGGKPRCDAPEALALAERLLGVMRTGLGDRCRRASLRLLGDPWARWPSSGGVPQRGVAVLVGFNMDASNLDRVLDRGPPAQDSKEAAIFRALWAQKAELRRFKDGSILECAVWAKPDAQRPVETRKKPAIITQIVRHLLERHFPAFASEAQLVSGPIGFVPNLGERERRLWLTFETFRTHLCQLSSLPLTIKDVHPESPGFSYAQLSPPAAPAAADGISRSVHGVVVEFESSGRWPDDPMAARKVAAAMLLQMREEMETDLGLEGGVTEDFLDVRYPEFVFRVRIFHPHEMMDTAHRVTNIQAPTSGTPPSPEAVERLRTLWWRPRIRATLHAQVLQLPALAGAMRLCKQWMASQLFSGYDEFAEHLAASVFLMPSPFDTPNSAHVALCRVCWLLDTFDWQKEPLIIDWDGKLADEERLGIRRSFERSRSQAEAAETFWVASRFDPHCMLLQTPPATACSWLRRRARHALGIYHRRMLDVAAPGGLAMGWDQLFAVDTSVFDVLVRLLPPSAKTEGQPRKTKGKRRIVEVTPELVVEFVAALQAQLSSVCLVFYDAESRLVALKWRPRAFFPQQQNVLMGAVPHTMIKRPSGPPLCVPNAACLTAAVAGLAEGLSLSFTVVG